MVGLVGGQPGRSAQQTRQQGNQSDADQGNTTARDELLNTLRLAGRIILTVTFQNGNSIGVNTDGYVFVNGKLRAIKSGDGRNLYHDLFVLFYPTAKE